MNKKQITLNSALTTALVLMFAICGCTRPYPQSTNQVHAAVRSGENPLENGAYSVLREAPTPQDARVKGVPQAVLAYDRRKYSDAPPNEPLTYVAIDRRDYVPLIIE